MQKTVKEIINEWLPDHSDEGGPYEYGEISYNEMEEILQVYENEITEKDKEIETHKLGYKLLKINYDDLKSKQLYKEDFEIKYYCTYHGKWDDCVMEDEEEPLPEQLENYIAILKDNSKYDKLPSKELINND